jgi:type II secretory pathway predicted ATPase ExeA
MIRSWFGLTETPFASDFITPLQHQQEALDILMVHCRQGGLCAIVGEPGVGKSYMKRALQKFADKQMLVITIGRALHSYWNIIQLLAEQFGIEVTGNALKIEKKLIEQAFSLHHVGKSLVTILDDAHLLEMETLRKLRLLFDDFPPNHNVILIGHPSLIAQLQIRDNHDIWSRITYSVSLKKIPFESVRDFLYTEFDKAGLGHHSVSEEALGLIIRSGEGLLRRTKNLCLSCFVEAVRDRKREVTLEMVNRVLRQPHWNMDLEDPSHLRGIIVSN